MLRPSLSVTKMGWLNPDWFRYGSVSCFPDTWEHVFYRSVSCVGNLLSLLCHLSLRKSVYLVLQQKVLFPLVKVCMMPGDLCSHAWNCDLFTLISSWLLWIRRQNWWIKKTFRNEDNLKNEDDLNYEDDFKNEEDINDEDNINNEITPKMEIGILPEKKVDGSSPWQLQHKWPEILSAV